MESARERLKNLLLILLEAVDTGGDLLRLDRQKLGEMVVASGYDEADLGGLLDWLELNWNGRVSSLLEIAEDADGPAGDGVRLLGEDEREFLTPRAFGYLLELCQGGQISRQQMEDLIHYASLVAVLPLQREEIDGLLEQVFFGLPGRAVPPQSSDRPRSVN